ncbi:hypothetical protein XELAEV_18045125mg [Xenopus laevis]|uniref:Uncharacterized protein n=1 Tax=Xenopus laevis TaxID=8355 RepID=A0A974H415_XENLA|nr:hypothetical protein XELAEV_18045125mg [Xenopus laevis]
MNGETLSSLVKYIFCSLLSLVDVNAAGWIILGESTTTSICSIKPILWERKAAVSVHGHFDHHVPIFINSIFREDKG